MERVRIARCGDGLAAWHVLETPRGSARRSQGVSSLFRHHSTHHQTQGDGWGASEGVCRLDDQDFISVNLRVNLQLMNEGHKAVDGALGQIS